MRLPRLLSSILLPLVGALLLLVGVTQASHSRDTYKTCIRWTFIGDLKVNPTEVWVYGSDSRGERMYGHEPLFRYNLDDENEVVVTWPHPENIKKLALHFPARHHAPGFTFQFEITSDFRFQAGYSRTYEFQIDLREKKVGAVYNPQSGYQ